MQHSIILRYRFYCANAMSKLTTAAPPAATIPPSVDLTVLIDCRSMRGTSRNINYALSSLCEKVCAGRINF